MKDYKTEVCKVYPSAVCKQVQLPHGEIRRMVFKHDGTTYASDAISTPQRLVKSAWLSAYEQLNSKI